MASIWIWNSIASRRRSASDTFVENGLGVLSTSVRGAGHEIRVIDWANSRFYRQLAPRTLAGLSRRLALRLMTWPAGERGRGYRFLKWGNMKLQQAIAWIQAGRLARRLRALAREVAASGLRVFGMKVWYGEAFTWAKYLATEIRKRNPGIVLVAGGYHATLYEEDFLRNSPFDLSVVSEGETALARILDEVDTVPTSGTLQAGDCTEKGRAPLVGAGAREVVLGRIREAIASGRLTNVVYRDGDQIRKTVKARGDINAKQSPVYGDVEGKVRIHVLLESSGCPWGKCSFCVHHHLEPEYLRRKVDRIVAEIRAMREQGIGLFRFAGSDTPPEFGAAIAQGILEAGIRMEFAMGSRAIPGAKDPAVFRDLVEKYELMIRAGLRAVFMGGETGNDTINERVMNKGLRREDLVYTIRALRFAERRAGHKVDVSLAMIYPAPLVEGVTQEQMRADNLALIEEARPDSVMVTPPGPFKNTDWFRKGKQFGFEFAGHFLKQLMEYEYVLFKPPELWPELGLKLRGTSFVGLLRECGRLREAVEAMGIPTDLSDEHFLMLRACGFKGVKGAQEFKRETLADIVSCCYDTLDAYSARTNDYSRELAGESPLVELDDVLFCLEEEEAVPSLA